MVDVGVILKRCKAAGESRRPVKHSGQDTWVVGDEHYGSLHRGGKEEYAHGHPAHASVQRISSSTATPR